MGLGPMGLGPMGLGPMGLVLWLRQWQVCITSFSGSADLLQRL